MFFILFLLLFCTGLTQLPVWPSDKQHTEESRKGGEGGGREAHGMCVHIRVWFCPCVYAFTFMWHCKSLILPAPSGHISCNRPSVKARQLTITGGGGGGMCGMGDYTRGLVSHTITSHIYWKAGYQSCVCMCTHTEGKATALWYSPKPGLSECTEESIQRRRTKER